MTEKEKLFSAAYNGMREKYSVKGEERYTKPEVVTMFKEAGFPHSDNYISTYVKVGMLEKHGLRYYGFPQTPIHYSVISRAIKQTRSKNREYTKKWRTKKSGKEISEPVLEEKASFFDEESAISELKLRGYKVFKARVEWDEL